MENVVLVIHLFLALAIIGLVLLQRSEGGGLGIGGGGGLGNLASSQGMNNALTKATTFCAIAFFCTSLMLGVLARGHSQAGQGIMDILEEQADTIAIEEAVDIDEPPSIPIAE